MSKLRRFSPAQLRLPNYPFTRVESDCPVNTAELKINGLAAWLFTSPVAFMKLRGLPALVGQITHLLIYSFTKLLIYPFFVFAHLPILLNLPIYQLTHLPIFLNSQILSLLFFDNRVVAVTGQAAAHGFGFFGIGEGAYLHVKERITGHVGDHQYRILLLSQSGHQDFCVFLL